jgi:hypothetical protein
MGPRTDTMQMKYDSAVVQCSKSTPTTASQLIMIPEAADPSVSIVDDQHHWRRGARSPNSADQILSIRTQRQQGLRGEDDCLAEQPKNSV